MQIDRVYIHAFGGLSQKEMHFTSGFSVIYGENEWGKTTVMKFIRMMLYGRTDRALREQIRPHSGVDPAGELDITVGGRAYRIRKTFMRSEKTDKVQLIRLDTGESLPLAVGEEVGQKLLGLDLESFLRCMFVPEDDVSTTFGSGASLYTRLRNLTQSGTEQVSFDKTMERIKKAIRDADKHIKEYSTQVTALSVKEARLWEEEEAYIRQTNQIQKERALLLELEQTHASLLCDCEAAHAREKLEKIHRYQEQLDRIASIEEALHCDTLPEEMSAYLASCRRAYEAYASIVLPAQGITDEAHARFTAAWEAYKKEEAPSACPQKKKGFFIGVFAAFVCLILGFWYPISWIFAGCFTVLSYFIYRKQKAVYQKAMAVYVAQMRARSMAGEELQAVLASQGCVSPEAWIWERSRQVHQKEEKEKARDAFEKKMAVFSAEDAQEDAFSLYEWLQTQWSELCSLKKTLVPAIVSEEEKQRLTTAAAKSDTPCDWARLNHINEQITQCRQRIAKATEQSNPPRESAAACKGEKEALLHKLRRYQAHRDALYLAQEGYTEAMAQMACALRPELNKRAGAYMQRLTRGKYNEITIDHADISVHYEGNEHGADRMSRGTAAQMYLAMRLAYGSVLGKEEPVFLFLDDALSDFDDAREQEALRVLSEEAGAGFSQILLFTCKRRLEEYNLKG